MSVHRYRSGSLTDQQIVDSVALGTATVTGETGALIDVILSDDGAKAALDIFMKNWGWEFTESNPTSPLPTQEAAVSIADATGGVGFTGQITVAFDTVENNMDPALYVVSAGTIQVKAAGTYEVSCGVQMNATSGTRTTSRVWVEVDPGGGFVAVPNVEGYGYHRNTSNGRDTPSVTCIPVTLDVDDIVRVRAERFGAAGSLATVAGSRFSVRRLS